MICTFNTKTSKYGVTIRMPDEIENSKPVTIQFQSILPMMKDDNDNERIFVIKTKFKLYILDVVTKKLFELA
jgi:hypothetical protein